MNVIASFNVIPGLVPGIHAFATLRLQDVDGRNECGHDVCCGSVEGRER